MGKKYSLKKPDSFSTRLKNNKKIAIRLLVSLVVFLSAYFYFLREGFYQIQDIYIIASLILIMIYCLFSLYVAKIKKDKKQNELTTEEKETIIKLEKTRKNLIVLFLPMFAAVMIDAVILFYDSFGISDFLGI
jgi:Ca2+/Na+ antiporter